MIDVSDPEFSRRMAQLALYIPDLEAAFSEPLFAPPEAEPAGFLHLPLLSRALCRYAQALDATGSRELADSLWNSLLCWKSRAKNVAQQSDRVVLLEMQRQVEAYYQESRGEQLV